MSNQTRFVQRNAIKSYYAATGGMIQNRLPLKKEISKGDRIYQILSFNKQQQLPEVMEVFAETDGIIFDVATNQSVNQGEYVLDILTT